MTRENDLRRESSPFTPAKWRGEPMGSYRGKGDSPRFGQPMRIELRKRRIISAHSFASVRRAGALERGDTSRGKSR